MTGPGTDEVPAGRLLTMRIIVCALVMGVLAFAGVAAFVRSQGAMPPTPDVPLVSYIAAGYGALMLLAWSVVPPAIVTGARRKLLAETAVTTGRLLDLFHTRLIVGAALLEGAAFFFLIAYMLEGLPWALAGGLFFAALLAMLYFPTREGVEGWVAEQREALAQERLGL
jgi:hypothetical protein